MGGGGELTPSEKFWRCFFVAENEINKFTILGETGSGKTCYLLGMYYEMTMGVAGYTLTTENRDEARNLKTRYKMLSNKKLGQSRFPDPTDKVQTYKFELQYALNSIADFEWIDYPGGFLDPMSENVNSEEYQAVEKTIKESDILFICIDGENLKGNDTRKKIRKVRAKCVNNINPYLNTIEGKFPPIAMIVTKYDLCATDTNEDEIKEILTKSFSFFERDDVFIAVIPVSIGENIEDDNYSGDLDPLNVHLPILLGINFALIRILELGRALIREYKARIENAELIKTSEEMSFFLWRNNKVIDEMKSYIKDAKQDIANIKEIAKYFKKSINRINDDLEEITMIFANGVWQDENSINKMWDDLQSVANYF